MHDVKLTILYSRVLDERALMVKFFTQGHSANYSAKVKVSTNGKSTRYNAKMFTLGRSEKYSAIFKFVIMQNLVQTSIFHLGPQ
jgi:hypothetical protein